MNKHDSSRQFDLKARPALARSWLMGLVLSCAVIALLIGSGSKAAAQDLKIECGPLILPVDLGCCDLTIGYAEAVYINDVPVSPPLDPTLQLTGVRADRLPLDAPYPLGDSYVTWTVKDTTTGNSDWCTQLIRISQPQVPDPCPTPWLAKKDVHDDLLLLKENATSDLSKFTAAVNYLVKSIDSNRWLDESHPKPGKAGEDVFNNEKNAVNQMLSLKVKYPAVVPLIDDLVSIDRLLATIAINEAIARDFDDAIARGGYSSKIATAQNYLLKGDNYVSAGKLTSAIDAYKAAWKNALSA